MLVGLPVIFGMLVFLFLAQNGSGRREAFLKALIVLGTVTVVLTEALGFFHILTVWMTAAGWGLACLIVLLLWRPSQLQLRFPPRELFISVPLIEKIYWGALISIIFIIGLIVLGSAPNTWDSLTYHLSRVEHWIQDRSLAHYPTNIIRQLLYCPFAEYALLQGMLLSGSDMFVNFVQFTSMIGSWVIVSLIAAALGADRKQQLLAVFLAATIPMGILQGSSTQTDYVATLWICAAVYWVLRWRQVPSLSCSIWTGLSFGLAFLTKGYSYVYLFFPFLALLFRSAYPFKLRNLILTGLTMGLSLTLSVGYFSRNMMTFGDFFGLDQGIVNRQYEPGRIAGDLLRNIGSHMASPVRSINHAVDKVFVGAITRVDKSKQTYEFQMPPLSKDEDQAGNLLHVLLGFATLGVWIFLYRRDTQTSFYILMLTAMAILLAVGINWQPWVSRFHLPFFVLACAWMGTVWGRFKSPLVMIVIGLIFYFAAQPWLWTGNPRRVLGHKSIFKETRIQQYFDRAPYLGPIYENFAGGLHAMGCHQIGLWIGSDDWEYPWWVLLKQKGYSIRLEHIKVDGLKNVTYPLGNFEPCAVISTVTRDQSALMVGGHQFLQVVQERGVGVFVRSR